MIAQVDSVVADSTTIVLDADDTYPSPSPDGTRIAFQSDRAGSQDIWLVDVDGNGLRRLTTHPTLDETPVWSPDGRSIVFASARAGERDVFEVPADGGTPRSLTANPGANDDHPKFSPDGSRIVFNSMRADGETYQIWVMNADGSHPRRLSHHVEWDTYPSFSPDGRRILFRRRLPAPSPADPAATNSEIFVMGADGSNPVNLSRHPAFDGYPDWAPDGRRIVFASNRGTGDRLRFRVYVMNADGSDPVPISPNEPGVSYQRPRWSPDGRSILATRTSDDVTRIAILHVSAAVFAPPFTELRGNAVAVDGGLSRGFTWGDLDGDGDPDLVVANSASQPEFVYRNDGADAFTQLFDTPVALGAGDTEGASLADYDGDGDLDLLVTDQFDEPLRLYRNEDGGEFHEARAGDLGDGTPFSANSACWADYDLDGDLDVFVVQRDGRDDLLFRNRGDGTFARVREDPVAASGGDGRACAWGDVDGDGDPDLYVGNFLEGRQKARNFLFLNQSGGFRRVAVGPPVEDRGRTYGTSFIDADNDGDLDLFVSNIARDDRNALYLNDGSGGFTALVDDPLVAAGGRPSKGHTWGDFDLDGDLDVYIANGTEADVDVRNFLFLNDGRGRFSAVRHGPPVERADTSAAAAWADYDRDGDLDLFVTSWGGNDEDNVLLRNETTGRHWLTIALRGTGSNRQGIGARVRLAVRRGGELHWQTRWLWPSTGYASQNEPVVHFGLGAAERVAELQVIWPSGVVDRRRDLTADRLYVVVEGH
jgi:Tol biopolymer transport system component